MKRFVLKTRIALILAILFAFSTVSAMADAALVTSGAQVYASADTSSQVLGTLSEGTQLQWVAERGGWVKVELNGRTGFMKSDSLAKIRTYSKKSVYTSEDTPMYKSPTTSSDKMGTIPSGAKVTLQATAGSWARVKYSKYTGFVCVSDLTANAPANNETSITAYANVDNAKVYNAKGKVIGTVGLNTEVIIRETRSGICRVERGGKTAYMMESELSTSKTETKQDSGITEISPTTFYVKSDGVKVYNSKGKVIGTLNTNDTVSVSAYTDTLAKISKNGTTAIMYRSDLSASKIEETATDNGITEISPTTFYVKSDGAKVYNSKGKVIGTLNTNDTVSVSAYTDTLAKVSKNGTTAIMYRSDLSASKIEEKTSDSGITEISPTTFYVKNDSAKVLGSDGSALGTLSVNTAVTVTAYNDTYAKVINGSAVGYMLRSDLSTSKADTQTSYVLQYGDKGEAVTKIQARLKELGYFSGTAGGNYLDLTRSAVTAFQAAAGLTTTGVCDEKTLTAMFADSAPKKTVSNTSTEVKPGNSTTAAATGTAKEMDWWTSDIQSIFARGTVVTVTDVATGISWREVRKGGTNHADVQPLTAADTAAMKKAVGSWSWTRRAIFVTINGVNYAASMNCMPHGQGSIPDNNFDGHHCIHFTNSRTHGSNKVCSLHQAAIKKAASATL